MRPEILLELRVILDDLVPLALEIVQEGASTGQVLLTAGVEKEVLAVLARAKAALELAALTDNVPVQTLRIVSESVLTLTARATWTAWWYQT